MLWHERPVLPSRPAVREAHHERRLERLAPSFETPVDVLLVDDDERGPEAPLGYSSTMSRPPASRRLPASREARTATP
ncbi:hypothetical protein D8S78_24260 [Natrialba swarupiae]|nr:hypothetical protein [Natrialba swarupiae]